MIHPIRLDPETHIYYESVSPTVEEPRPGYSGICKAMGVSRPNPFFTQEGREQGQAIHQWLYFLAQNKKSTAAPDPRIANRVEGVRKFLADTRFLISGGETPLYEPTLSFCVMPDLWGHIGKLSFVIDGKRGAKLKIHRLQTAAQKLALKANGFNASRRAGLYLRDNDYRLDQHDDVADERNWVAIVRGFHAMTREERRVFRTEEFKADDPAVIGLTNGPKWRAIVSAFNARRLYIS